MTQGQKFAAWRAEQKGPPSQSEIAKKLGVKHPAVISHLENDRYKPGLDLALEIEKLTGGAVKTSDWPKTKRKKYTRRKVAAAA